MNITDGSTNEGTTGDIGREEALTPAKYSNISNTTHMLVAGLTFDKELNDVNDFRVAMPLYMAFRGNIPPRVANLHRACVEQARRMMEEVIEFLAGVSHDNIYEMADALVDLVYFAKGTASILGLPWEELWAAVHTANMKKTKGITKRGDSEDAAKPEDWRPPDIKAVIDKYIYLEN